MLQTMTVMVWFQLRESLFASWQE